jgi:hypothetical protein
MRGRIDVRAHAGSAARLRLLLGGALGRGLLGRLPVLRGERVRVAIVLRQSLKETGSPPTNSSDRNFGWLGRDHTSRGVVYFSQVSH